MGHKIHLGTAIVAGLAFGLVIVAWSTFWYYENVGSTKVHYYWDHAKSNIGDTTFNTKYNKSSHTAKIFHATLSMLTIGGAILLGFIASVILRALFFKKTWIFKLLTVVTGIASVIFLAIAFFTFLGFTKASKDDGACFGEILSDNNSCHKFIGNVKSVNFHWGAGPGFWVLLGAIVLNLFAAGSAVKAAF